jgi:carbamoyl-phosphate synthase small subunit
MGGVDTRRLTRAIRQQGAPHVALAHDPDGNFDIEALVSRARLSGAGGSGSGQGRDLRAILSLG